MPHSVVANRGPKGVHHMRLPDELGELLGPVLPVERLIGHRLTVPTARVGAVQPRPAAAGQEPNAPEEGADRAPAVDLGAPPDGDPTRLRSGMPAAHGTFR